MGQNANSNVAKIMNEAAEAALEMSALLREAESSRKEAEQFIHQLRAGHSPKVKDYLAGKRALNSDEKARMEKIEELFRQEVGDLESSRKAVAAITKDLERLHLGELTKKGRTKITL